MQHTNRRSLVTSHTKGSVTSPRRGICALGEMAVKSGDRRGCSLLPLTPSGIGLRFRFRGPHPVHNLTGFERDGSDRPTRSLVEVTNRIPGEAQASLHPMPSQLASAIEALALLSPEVGVPARRTQHPGSHMKRNQLWKHCVQVLYLAIELMLLGMRK